MARLLQAQQIVGTDIGLENFEPRCLDSLTLRSYPNRPEQNTNLFIQMNCLRLPIIEPSAPATVGRLAFSVLIVTGFPSYW